MVTPLLTNLSPIFLLGYMRSIALPELFGVNIRALRVDLSNLNVLKNVVLAALFTWLNT